MYWLDRNAHSRVMLGNVILLLLYSPIWINGSIPSEDDVLQAINASRTKTEDYRRTYLGTRSKTVCPMARYHHQDERLPNTSFDIITNDLIEAKTLLLALGYTEEELSSINVTEIFNTESGRCCSRRNSSCIDNKYRSIDGLCNNLKYATWGASGATQTRLLDSVYDDGFNLPRMKSVQYGYNLPDPRRVSNAVHIPDRHEDLSTRINLHLLQMGQFVANDIINTPIQSVVKDCCEHPVSPNFCMPIRIYWHRDPNIFFRRGYCMNIQRSKARFCGKGASDIIREQINILTSFVDGSNIYGSSHHTEVINKATQGLLNDPDKNIPQHSEDCTTNVKKSIFCTIEGTRHINVIPILTAYRTLFVKEHNRIAEELRTSFPDDDEELFQETRRIVIGVMQKIIYDEFLPAFLPPKTISKYNLSSDIEYEYENLTNPTVLNEFGIAFRLGHTWIPRFMAFLSSDMYISDPNNSTYNDTFVSEFEESLDSFASLVLSETAPLTDRRIEGSVRDLLFLDNAMTSFDLAALNIQRGRDHGIPSYSEYRTYCGLSEVTTFDDLVNHTDAIRIRLSAVYRDARDIDLFTGALSETRMSGGEVGPTLACIIGQQFRRLKYGDRFWYQGGAVGFNSTHISAIREYSFAKVLCNNLNVATVNYPNAFLSIDPITNCDNIPQLNLTFFKTTNI